MNPLPTEQVTAPEIIQLKEPSYLCVLERDTTGSVNCTATGFPRPTIIWERLLGDDLVRVPAPPNLRLRQLDNGSLAFFPATLGDFGYYRCTASNQAGSDYIDIILFVAGEWLTHAAESPITAASHYFLYGSGFSCVCFFLMHTFIIVVDVKILVCEIVCVYVSSFVP